MKKVMKEGRKEAMTRTVIVTVMTETMCVCGQKKEGRKSDDDDSGIGVCEANDE